MANNKTQRTFLLEFEKPLVELQTRITQIRELAEENKVDVSGELQELEDRAEQLRKEIFSTLTPAQKLPPNS